LLERFIGGDELMSASSSESGEMERPVRTEGAQ
jgi:hypothetical protein